MNDKDKMEAQVRIALKLAYVKLIQCGGFDVVGNVVTPDLQAKKQILEAIHTYDPDWDYQTGPTA